MTQSSYLSAVRERVVIFDGASGTWLQAHELGPDDFGGEALEGCNEILCDTRPELISQMHREYLEAGADVIETNSFGAFGVPLAEYDMPERAHELSLKSAQLARAAADEFSTPKKPRWVGGSMGPGTKFATLGNISYEDLRASYYPSALGLLEGGVDLFVIETQFDLLGAKAAMAACRDAMAEVGREVPIQVQVTIELTGRMLPGTEISAALVALDAMGPDVIGINCATGPVEMAEHVRHLSQNSRVPIVVMPNAGLPSVVDGKMHYDLTAEQFVEHQTRFVEELGVTIVGGCCGTTPDYIRQLAEAVGGRPATWKPGEFEPGATSIYSLVPFEQDASFLIIGERTNANGSKRFREALLEGDWDTCVKMAKDQVKEGAHVLDVCVDYVGRDGVADMEEIASRFATQSTAPLVLDSTEPEVMEAGLRWMGGRAILNSANLEDGEAEGSRLDRVMKLAGQYGAAVICLLIDEKGQARDVDWKVAIAHRIHDLAINRYGLESSDLIFDALTFPLSTGDDDLREDAMATINAIRRIKEELPGVHTALGVSNVSFGLNPAARHVLNSVFLNECVKAGLDSAIVHAARIMPLAKIPEEQKEVALDLIYNRRGTEGTLSEGDKDYDPLVKLLEVFSDVNAAEAVVEDRTDWTLEDILSHRIIDGDKEGLTDDLDKAMAQGIAPLSIINDILLAGMKIVGERFGAGEMQLPFVLQSAETMKASVAHLEPHMETAEDDTGKGSIVLGTVKGDVHDIGKNLVDIILTNNGYTVHNMGIKVPITEMIDKALETKADAIGMSGLLVKSTLVMRDNLLELTSRDLEHIPVMLGGAALTRAYVERDLRENHPGRLFYGKDAFEGLHTMDRLMKIKAEGEQEDDKTWGIEPGGREIPGLSERMAARAGETTVQAPADLPARSPDVATDNHVFMPPFLGTRVIKGIPIDEIATWINETTLYRNQWQFRPETGEDDVAFKDRLRSRFREELAKAREDDLLVPTVAYGYFPVNGDGNDVVVWTDENRNTERARFKLPRQHKEPYLCIADFFRSVDSGEPDYLAAQIVTMGSKVSERTAELFAANNYTEYLYLHGLGVEMAEALAERWHRRIREEWGFADEDPAWDGSSPDRTALTGLFRQKYRSGRYSFGYPACPDLEDNAILAELLDAESIGIECNEDTGWQYHPEQTTSAIICHHPRAKYFVAR
ncbi:methionine synthase [Candidatus Microthrix parvicella]|uniref:methionine synthase n=1 Tax=Candidatus Neomicrothrix parvicella TaxID=41950 RepID=UPI000369A884|nr:methionine synthase [Candidatus Microthrix parvicella]